MFENILGLLVLIGSSTFWWVMVFKVSTRRKLNNPSYDFFRISKEDRESWDGLSLATSLVFAMVFSLVSIVWVVVAIYQWLKHSI